MNFLRSVLLTPPIGLTSAAEQLSVKTNQQGENRASVRFLSLVFGVIASEGFVDVGATKNKQSTVFASRPRKKLGKHVSENHS